MSQWIEPFLNDAKNWTSFISNMTQRIEFFLKWLKVLNFFFFLKMWLKRIELCKYDSENWTFPFFNTTHRIKDWCFFFFQFDSKNWIWFKALNPLFQFDSKNWTFFSNMTHRIEPLVLEYDSQKLLNYNLKNWFVVFKYDS